MIDGWYRLNADGSTEPTQDLPRQNIDERRIARTEVPQPPVEVSTVFLSLDHRHGTEGPPILFETMIFGGPYDQDCTRYATKAEAQQGHDETVADLRDGGKPRWLS
jgi:hypothetical protein